MPINNYRILCFLALLYPVLASAELGGLQECRQITDNEQRLACYDRLTARQITSIDETAGSGQWQVTEGRSPLDDSKNIVLNLKAQSEVQSAHLSVHPVLSVKCEHRSMSVTVDWGLYLEKNSTRMLSRFNEEAPLTEKWLIGDSYRGVYKSQQIKSYLDDIAQHQQLHLRIEPFSGEPIVASFSISGFLEAIAPYKQYCSW